ncbi:MAG: hypothetical protein KAI73_00475 [Rhodospirillaceae bacterium]|nr:hypothetical protein [Rhodospirillaceae bacterium]
MVFLSAFWSMWTQMFSSLPYGATWVAPFAMVATMIMVGKMIKGVMEFTG